MGAVFSANGGVRETRAARENGAAPKGAERRLFKGPIGEGWGVGGV